MEASGKSKKPHMGRRRLVGIVLGVGTLLVGLFVLVEQAWVASELQPFLGAALSSGSTPVAGFTPYGSLSYVVYAIGIGLVLSGIGLARSIFRSSVSSYVSGGGAGMTGMMGMNPEALQGMMQTSMAHATAASAAAGSMKPAVKVKCRNCGSLEEEDATYCRKCGQAM
jgi:ribosomal protein L40E